VRDDDPRNPWPPQSSEHLPPALLGAPEMTGIDDRPTVVALERIGVDVIERVRQGVRQPMDAVPERVDLDPLHRASLTSRECAQGASNRARLVRRSQALPVSTIDGTPSCQRPSPAFAIATNPRPSESSDGPAADSTLPNRARTSSGET
jgi:hypothetical protein